MRRFKTIVALMAAAMLLIMPGMANLEASAAEPVTYSLKYVEGSGEWRFVEGLWDDSAYHRELYYMMQSIKDGDLVVIEGGDQPLRLEIPVNLNNLTFNHAHSAVITAKSVENVYVLRDSVAAVNGDVVNAHVYDNAIVNFNSNVTNLYITKERSGSQTIAVVGTVAYVRTGDAEKVYNEFYNFQANSFRQEEGVLKTDASKYSTIPGIMPGASDVPVIPDAPVVPAVPAAPAEPVVPAAPVVPAVPVAPAAPVVPVVPVSPAVDSEYDDVPQTGDSSGHFAEYFSEYFSLPPFLLAIIGVCACLGGACLAREAKQK